METLYCSQNRLIWKKKRKRLCHLAGIIAAEELRKLRSKKLRKRWKACTAMKIDCFRNKENNDESPFHR